MNKLWTEKYRPKSEKEFEGQPHVKKLLLMDNHPNLLLYGPPGTGKTTFAHLISTNKLELNASDERGIGVIRDKIKGYASTLLDNKTVILDECENLTDDAQHCLRRIIEDSKSTRFIFITNYLSKIISPLISRLVKIKFKVSPNGLLEEIGKKEGLGLEHKEYEKIFRFCNYDLRRSINVLQGISPLQGNVLIEEVVGIVPIDWFKKKGKEDKEERKEKGMDGKEKGKDQKEKGKEKEMDEKEFLLKGYSVLQLIHQLGETTLGGTDEQKSLFSLELSKMEEKSTVGCSDELVLTKLLLSKKKIYA